MSRREGTDPFADRTAENGLPAKSERETKRESAEFPVEQSGIIGPWTTRRVTFGFEGTTYAPPLAPTICLLIVLRVAFFDHRLLRAHFHRYAKFASRAARTLSS
jgi:hypothetical protein